MVMFSTPLSDERQYAPWMEDIMPRLMGTCSSTPLNELYTMTHSWMHERAIWDAVLLMSPGVARQGHNLGSF